MNYLFDEIFQSHAPRDLAKRVTELSPEAREILRAEPTRNFADVADLVFDVTHGFKPKTVSKRASGDNAVARTEVDGQWSTEYAADGRLLRSWSGARPDFEQMHTYLAKSADKKTADYTLALFRKDHDAKNLEEQLGPVVERACRLLSPEHAELLRKGMRCLDLSVVTFFLERAFCTA